MLVLSIEYWGDWRRTYHDSDETQYYLDDEDVAVIDGVLKELSKKYPTLTIGWEQDDCELLIVVIETKPLSNAKQ